MRTISLFLYIVLFSLSANVLQAQKHQGVLWDKVDNIPVAFASLKSERQFFSSKKDGSFNIVLIQDLEIRHVSYENLVLKKEHVLSSDTIFLTPKAFKLEDITIRAKREITRIPKRHRKDVVSFGLMKPDRMLVLHKAYIGKNQELCLYDDHGTLLSSLSLEYEFKKLEQACNNLFFLKDRDYAYQVIIKNGEIFLENKISMEEHKRYFGNCVFADSLGWGFEYKFVNDIISSYYLINRSGQLIHLKKITDEQMFNGYMQEIGYIEKGKMLNNIGTNDIALNQKIRNFNEDADFLENVFYKHHDDNYIFSIRDKIQLFNLQKDSLHVYDDQGRIIEQTPFNIEKPERLFTNYEHTNIYQLTNEGDEYVLWILNEKLEFIKFLRIQAQKIIDLEIAHDQIYYLKSVKNGLGIKKELCIEKI